MLFDLLLLSLLIISTRLATFLHEVFGHAMTAVLTGGTVHAIQISLFGGGRVWADTETSNAIVLFFYHMSGIIINALTGIVLLAVLGDWRHKGFTRDLFMAVFALVSLCGSLAYMVLGLYYGYGDPVNWMNGRFSWFGRFWIFFLVLSPFAACLSAKCYLRFQEAVIPSETFFRRIGTALLTLGVSCAVYFALFVAANQDLAAARAPDAAYARAKAEIVEKKRKEIAENLRRLHPQLADGEIKKMAEDTVVETSPDEVPVKFPLIPVLAVLYVGGGLVAAFKTKPGNRAFCLRRKSASTWAAALTAATVLAVLAFSGGFIYSGTSFSSP